MEWEKEGCAEGRIEVRERWGGGVESASGSGRREGLGMVRFLYFVCRVRGRVRALTSPGSPPVSPVPCFLAAST